MDVDFRTAFELEKGEEGQSGPVEYSLLSDTHEDQLGFPPGCHSHKWSHRGVDPLRTEPQAYRMADDQIEGDFHRVLGMTDPHEVDIFGAAVGVKNHSHQGAAGQQPVPADFVDEMGEEFFKGLFIHGSFFLQDERRARFNRCQDD